MGKNLVLNVGSSSIRYALFENLKKIKQGKKERLEKKRDFENATKEILKEIPEEINLIAHRVVHGGEIKTPQKINKKIKNQIKKFSEFAPLHNPKEIRVIEFCEKLKIPQYAVFDTSFFSELPEVASTYPIPKNLTKKYDIKRYGFHGISHKYVAEKGKTITCHFGAGCSITAMKNKKPLDTSMGLTPLEGMMMATRSGSIDPGIIFFLEKKGYKTEEILNLESGLKGISNKSDFRDIRKNLKNKDSKLAYGMFIYQATKLIASYIGTLNGLDNLVFTGAIGKNVPMIRKDICENLSFIGIKLNNKKNKNNEELISSGKVKIFAKQTDEETQILKEVLNENKN
jgi:acetate kinase